MIGRQQIEINATDLVRGMSTSDDTNDGGFSPSTSQVNLIANPGVLNSPALAVDKSTNLTGNIILSADDPNYLGNDKMFLDDEGAFYTWNGTTLTKKVTDSTSAYLDATSAFVPYKGYWYITQQNGNDDDITRWDGNATLVNNWWSALAGDPTTLQSSSQRPMIVYEDNLWVGNRNILGKFDGTTGVHKLTLDSFQSIVALGIDPSSGYLLIATHQTGGANGSGTKNGVAKILLYDGFSNKPLRSVIVDGMVTSFYTLGGQVYVFYGNKMGYWNGAGITFLRKTGVTFQGGSLITPPHITSIDNTLYYADGLKIIAYGEVMPGRKVFYPVWKQEITSNQQITCISAISEKDIGISWDDGSGGGKFYVFDVTSVSTEGTKDFQANRVNFPRPVFIRHAYIEWYNSIANNITPGTLRVLDETGSETLFSSLQNLSGSAVYTFETKSMDKKVRSAKIRYVGDTVVAGIRRIIIYYDVSE